MEFPELGSHCSQPDCNQLDFLPVKCDACGKKFCSHHWKYEEHSCPQRHTRDAQVPVCPLCDQPVPSARGVVPDIAVSAHIDADCKSDRAVQKRIYTNRCSVRHCKQKELVKIQCDTCRKNFCLKHRHPQDHECSGKTSSSSSSSMSRAGMAAFARLQQATQPKQQTATRSQPPPVRPNISSLQGGLSEDEALRRALEASMRDQPAPQAAPSSQEEQDRMLAEAIARSEREQGPSSSSKDDSKSCRLS